MSTHTACGHWWTPVAAWLAGLLASSLLPPWPPRVAKIGAREKANPGAILVRFLAPGLECPIGQLLLVGRRVDAAIGRLIKAQPTPVTFLPCVVLPGPSLSLPYPPHLAEPPSYAVSPWIQSNPLKWVAPCGPPTGRKKETEADRQADRHTRAHTRPPSLPLQVAGGTAVGKEPTGESSSTFEIPPLPTAPPSHHKHFMLPRSKRQGPRSLPALHIRSVPPILTPRLPPPSHRSPATLRGFTPARHASCF
ncbi:hypothetical protein G7046_g4791 [Stylonectria norvegica]|nr:hypothetical protein G7046_g4791 [Stylonectria norvegica]